MKKVLPVLLMLLLTLSLGCALASQGPTLYTCGDYMYILLEDGTAAIMKYSGKAEQLTIASELDGYRVTSIWEGAFSFRNSLTSVTIPDSVTSIGTNPFRNCSRLVSINISPGHPTYTTIDGVLFEKSTEALICYPMAKADTDYAIPQGTLIIGGHAFDDCNSLISIAIPDSVISIRNRAFNACGSLTSVSLT